MLQSFQRKYLEIISFISPYFLELIEAIIYDLPKLIIPYFIDLIDYIKSHLPELKEFIISYSFKKFIYFFKI